MRGQQKKRSTDEQIVDELAALRRSVDAFSTNVGKWLAAVAKAASTPVDNSAEVQALIDDLTKEINASTDRQEEALKSVEKQTKGE